MATHTCNQNCGCNNTYTVTPPCPPACPEVFNSQCIVYTGTDIICNTDTVIKRYDYLDTVITKLVNYICNTVAPVTQVVGSTYIDVVPNTVGNVTTYTVYADVPALQAYFDLIIAQTIASSVLAGIGIDVAVNPVTNTVTVSHEDTSAVITPQTSTNTGNTFIQSASFTFDTFGHVTGAAFTPGTVTPPNDYNKAQIYPDSLAFSWGPANDPTNIQEAESPGDTLNFVAGTGIVLNASTVSGTDAIRITNSAPNIVQDLWLTIEADAGLAIAASNPGDALTVTGGKGITTSTSPNTLTIVADVAKFSDTVNISGAGATAPVVHGLATEEIIISVKEDGSTTTYVHGINYSYTVDDANTITVKDIGGTMVGDIIVTVIG
jgi:hypothetical protein